MYLHRIALLSVVLTATLTTAAHAGPADLPADVAKEVDGFTLTGSPIVAALDKFQPIPLKVDGMKCYVAVVRLADGAQLSALAKQGIGFETNTENKAGKFRSSIGGELKDRVGYARLGCGLSYDKVALDIRATMNSGADPSHVHDLGTGNLSVQLYVKTPAKH